jgi:hypothetical protein
LRRRAPGELLVLADDLQEGLPAFELPDASTRYHWTAAELKYLRDNWRTSTAEQIASILPLRTRNSVIGAAHRLGLPPKAKGRAPTRGPGRVRKAFASKGDDATLSRFVKTGPPLVEQLALLGGPRQVDPKLLRRPEVVAGRSRFHRKGIGDPATAKAVLVSGHCNAKIGRDVRKGRLRGYWIYTLSLEERATCPRTCHHWATCYGNHMPYANRWAHDDPAALTVAIERDLDRLLAVRGRAGILVRLHALGDFFSPEYVTFWAAMLAKHPRLAVFGYTARLPGTPIGDRIAAVRAHFGFERFAIRYSDGGQAQRCTQSVRAVDEAVNSILCPEQSGRTQACATCALCWTTPRNIAFLEH